uniref:Microtubule associated protein 11 n=1 Tax=Anser cygnoides TaxID=8845 RepID=A0A8B9EFQ0_ANSCY
FWLPRQRWAGTGSGLVATATEARDRNRKSAGCHGNGSAGPEPEISRHIAPGCLATAERGLNRKSAGCHGNAGARTGSRLVATATAARARNRKPSLTPLPDLPSNGAAGPEAEARPEAEAARLPVPVPAPRPAPRRPRWRRGGHGVAVRVLHLPVEDPIVCPDEVIFPLTIALDKLPPGTVKAKIVVTVWKRDTEPAELQEGGGYLGLLQSRAPAHVFHQEQGAFKAQVSTLLTVLPPPVVRCRQLTVSGKYLTVLKVLNGCSQEEISLRDVRILPNFNASYLPVMPDGSVLLVDDVCHHSGEVPVGAFCRVAGAGSACPCALSALEEHNFLFQLQAPERPPEDAKEGLEVPLVAVVQWSTPKLPFTSSIYTHYRLPSIRLERPRFVMTAACESPVRARQRFTVTYTLLNELQDFLAVRLVWTPDTATAGGHGDGGRGQGDSTGTGWGWNGAGDGDGTGWGRGQGMGMEWDGGQGQDRVRTGWGWNGMGTGTRDGDRGQGDGDGMGWGQGTGWGWNGDRVGMGTRWNGDKG